MKPSGTLKYFAAARITGARKTGLALTWGEAVGNFRPAPPEVQGQQSDYKGESMPNSPRMYLAFPVYVVRADCLGVQNDGSPKNTVSVASHSQQILPEECTACGRAEDFRRVTRKLGFSKSRQRGSHERWVHPDGRASTIAASRNVTDSTIVVCCYERLRRSSINGRQPELGAYRMLCEHADPTTVYADRANTRAASAPAPGSSDGQVEHVVTRIGTFNSRPTPLGCQRARCCGVLRGAPDSFDSMTTSDASHLPDNDFVLPAVDAVEDR